MTLYGGDFPILSLITYIPLAGALLLLLIPKEKVGAIRTGATVIAAIDFALAVPLWWTFDFGPASALFQFREDASWIDALGVRYIFAVDGISMILVLMTTLIGLIAIYSSFTAIRMREKEYYVLILFLQTGMIGAFCALDFFLFYVFWEVMLVPMYFLIGVWGGPRRLYASIKFFLYTLSGSVLMLLAILALYFFNSDGIPLLNIQGLGNVPTFAVEQYHAIGHLIPPTLQFWLFLGFFFAFAIKVPMFPFHTWLPDAHVEAPTAGSVILAAVLLKMGTYGFVRFSLPILPDASVRLAVPVVILAIIGIIYGAFVSLVQKDMKKLVAYSSVSHLGFVMLGMFAFNPMGVTGSVLQMINHGISTGALFLLVGIIYERTHTRMIADYGGLAKQMPVYAAFFLITALSSMGLPALNGFVGEFTILLGAANRNIWWGVAAAVGIVLGAAYLLWLYQRVFWGPLDNPKNRDLVDITLTGREAWTLIPLVALMIWIGVYPKPFFDRLERPVNYIVEKIDPDYFTAERLSVPPPPSAPTESESHAAVAGTVQ
ncbi:MAG TPA: NADH-quinone oxidoreductase subunit M [Thermoanaerobaculia bacterium]|nr:NADH-quinone oxidoreductase subunit M [Thermoanaerobaculia bacterium]